MGLSQISDILFIGIGIYCVVRGIMLLLTGKLAPREEIAVRGYSERGLRRYKILSAVMNIITGLLISVVFLIRMLGLIKGDSYRLIFIALIAVLLVVYFVIRNTCKKI